MSLLTGMYAQTPPLDRKHEIKLYWEIGRGQWKHLLTPESQIEKERRKVVFNRGEIKTNTHRCLCSGLRKQ